MTPGKTFVQLPDGTEAYKLPQDIGQDDMVFFDGPGAFAATERLQAQLDAEIETAGGLEAWRKAGAGKQRLAA
jgi:hypothetical protein